MRPVNRGLWPTDDHGDRKQFSEYIEAQADLIDRLGEYCSYCERPIDRNNIEEDPLDPEEEIAELIENDGKYDDDDDEESL